MDPTRHYESNRDTYTTIDHTLNTTRRLFESSDRFNQRVLLFDATTYAVMSVQNSVDMLRRGFTAYADADDWDGVRDACKGLNYGKNKYRYIRENFDTAMNHDDAIDRLEAGDIRGAVDVIADEFMGVSYIKAAFSVAMLGFTETLCVDTNVAQMMDGDVEAKGYNTIEDYYDAVNAVLDRFDGLSERLDPFLVQWVLFSAQREDGVTLHDEFFNHVLPGTNFARQSGLNDF